LFGVEVVSCSGLAYCPTRRGLQYRLIDSPIRLSDARLPRTFGFLELSTACMQHYDSHLMDCLFVLRRLLLFLIGPADPALADVLMGIAPKSYLGKTLSSWTSWTACPGPHVNGTPNTRMDLSASTLSTPFEKTDYPPGGNRNEAKQFSPESQCEFCGSCVAAKRRFPLVYPPPSTFAPYPHFFLQWIHPDLLICVLVSHWHTRFRARFWGGNMRGWKGLVVKAWGAAL